MSGDERQSRSARRSLARGSSLSPKTRRDFLRDASLLGVAVSTLPENNFLAAAFPQSPAPAVPELREITLKWLGEKPPAAATGVSFGVPFPQGAVAPNTAFALTSGSNRLPLQSWPLAYWPDGSIKWSGFATVVPAGFAGPATLATDSSTPSRPGPVPISVKNDGRALLIDTGAMQCSIPLAGSKILNSIAIGGKAIAGAAQLVCILQHGPSTTDELSPTREEFTSAVRHVTVEQSGPVRTVIKIEGMHRGAVSQREWLPFVVRLYFYASQPSLRLVHTIVFDGNQEKDFVRGLGLQFDVPLRDEPRNRTVRFAGSDGGMWSEPLQPGGGSMAQETGQSFTPNPIFLKNAVWDSFKLTQPTPHGFIIVKRTNPKSAWVFSAAGKRAPGFAFLGDLGGGLGLSVKNFWQSYPSGLEIRAANAPMAQLIAWLWSPDAPEMDMRHYDTHAHGLDASYEDVQPGLSTAYGVARTSELTLYPQASWPTRAECSALAAAGQQLPLLAGAPEYIHSTGVFGAWSLPDRSTAFKKSIEDGLDSVLAFYQRQVDDRSWYGFWQFGDFMHSYSATRHVWHYDWGGHAWDNTELGVPLWLWASYLRSGRADLFRLAEAHTRNTSETCVYHLGPMKGLGSRHNVIKWGDGAKEARISQAAHWRFFYYLTTDERTGDIMHMVAESAGVAVAKYDPMREAAPRTPSEPAVRIRIGPDWFALAGNWMTEWERTNNDHWLGLIVSGVDSIVTMPFGLETGKPASRYGAAAAIVGFDNSTGKLTPIPDPVTKSFAPANYNLATIQGGAEVMFELVPLLGRNDFAAAWLRMCRIGVAPAEVWQKDQTTGDEGADASFVIPGQSGPRLAAWAYAKTSNKAFAKKAIASLLSQGGGIVNPHLVSGADSLNPVAEDPRINTNEASQTGLQAIEILELCKDQLPTETAVWTPRFGRPRQAPTAPR